MTPEGEQELKIIGGKLGMMQLEHDTRLLAPALMNHAVYLYRLLVRAKLEKPEILERIMTEFTSMALAPNTDAPPAIVSTELMTSKTKN